MMSTAQTEERLRSWLDGNQVQRERMCLALLSLDTKYSNIKPRRPKGGPDGARDIEAVYEDRLQVWGGVGFRNSAKDSGEDKNWAVTKFKTDVDGALEKNPNLEGFVFFTNIDLTPSEVDGLLKYAADKGLSQVEVFYRERLRVLLDSIEGFGYRLQYLDIEMSKEEQVAFFERSHSRFASQFEAVDKKLERIDFFNECSKEVFSASLIVEFDKMYTPYDLGHFRVMLEIINLNKNEPHPTLWLAGRDAYSVFSSGETKTKLFGHKMIVWSRNPDDAIQNTMIGGASPGGRGFNVFSGIYNKGPYTKLTDFDRRHVSLYITNSLLDKIRGVWLVVNNFMLLGYGIDDLVPKEMSPLTDWPEELSNNEQEIPWLALLGKGDDPSLPPPAWPTRNLFIDFSRTTPVKLQ